MWNHLHKSLQDAYKVLFSISRSLGFSLMSLGTHFLMDTFYGLVRGSRRCFLGDFAHLPFSTFEACGGMSPLLQTLHVGHEHLVSLWEWYSRPTVRQFAARRSLVHIFHSLAHTPRQQGPEMHAHSISSRTPYLLGFFK